MSKEGEMLSIHLTDICNNRCWFCVVDSPGQRVDFVSRNKINRFLEAHSDMGYSAVNLHGGEPTVRKDFLDILQKIKECGYPRVILQTNARKLSIKEFAKKTCELGVDLCVVSVHGSESSIHDEITQVPKSLDQALWGIKNVKELGCKVRINSVVSKMNYQDIPDIVRLLVSLKVDHINISALHTVGAAFKNFQKVTPTYKESMPYVQKAIAIAKKANTVLTLEGFPLCAISDYHENLIDWDNQKFKMLFRGVIIDNYESYMDNTMRAHGEICTDCKFKDMCGGVYKEYTAVRGWDEFIEFKKNM